jgi:hypothetical protein
MDAMHSAVTQYRRMQPCRPRLGIGGQPGERDEAVMQLTRRQILIF